MKKLYWNPDTLNYLAGLNDANGFAHVAIRALEFVEENCTTEDGETTLDLFADLITQVEEQIEKEYYE